MADISLLIVHVLSFPSMCVYVGVDVVHAAALLF